MTTDVVKVAGPYKGEANGPIWDGEAVLFSLPAEHRILRYHPGTENVAEYRNYTVGARGLALGPDRCVYACQSAGRRVVRFNVDGSASMLADRFADGQLHNNPYDLAFDSLGRIWFTDPEPPARTFEPLMGYAAVLRLEHDAAAGWSLRRMTNDTSFPTGLLLAPDERTLYVADSPRDAARAAELRAYPIAGDGALGAPSVVHSFAPGIGLFGMCLMRDGTIALCTGGNGTPSRNAVTVLSTGGKVMAEYPFEQVQPTNCVLVTEANSASLYVTASDASLYRIGVSP